MRLQPVDPPAATLALVAAVALHETVDPLLEPAVRTRLAIKWPNDLLLGDAKLAGMLLERAGDAVVIGIGVNLAGHPADLDRPTTSLAAYDLTIPPGAFLERLAPTLSAWIARWRNEGLAPVRERWAACAHPLGTSLTVRLPDGTQQIGTFAGLDTDGALMLRLADGATRAIHAGDVFLI